MRHAAGRLGLIAAVTAVLAAGCGDDVPTRSVEAFCSTMRSEKERILAQLDDTVAAGEATDDELAEVLLGLGGSIQAIGELRTYFTKLADVAPEEIRVETEIVADAIGDQLDAAGDAVDNPLGAIGSMLVSSLTTSGQLATVNAFAQEHCGESI